MNGPHTPSERGAVRQLIRSLIGTGAGYRLWASPFRNVKMRAIRQLLPSAQSLRVLDVGCGPGTNAALFRGCEYVGVDLAPAYIRSAARRFPDMTFVLGDARRLSLGPRLFDVVLLNSVLHHMDDPEVEELLGRAARYLAPTGVMIAQEPLVPDEREVFPRFLMRLDRGGYFRELDHWRRLFRRAHLRVERERPYPIRILGLTGWHMVSFLLRPPPVEPAG